LLGSHFALGKLVLLIARASLRIASTIVHSLTHLHSFVIALSLLHIWQSILLSSLLYAGVIIKHYVWIVLLIDTCWSTPIHCGSSVIFP
jgi:hypothetical protein